MYSAAWWVLSAGRKPSGNVVGVNFLDATAVGVVRLLCIWITPDCALESGSNRNTGAKICHQNEPIIIQIFLDNKRTYVLDLRGRPAFNEGFNRIYASLILCLVGPSSGAKCIADPSIICC